MKQFSSLPLILTVLVIGLLFSECSKQRIALNEYEDPQQFMWDNRPQEQEFVLDTGGSGPIIGNQGTRLWLDSSIFMFPGGGDVSYPIIIKLVEVYTPKDMMLYEMPTLAQGQLLTTGGEIRVRAFKDGTELVLKPGKSYFAQIPAVDPVQEMSLFFGMENGNQVDWWDNASAVSSNPGIDSLEWIVPNTDSIGIGYDIFNPVMGWINCDYFASYDPNSLTTINFTSVEDDLSNVMIFLYFPELESVMQVWNQESGNVPIDSHVKSICFAINSSGTFVYHLSEFDVTPDHSVEVVLLETTEQGLLDILAGL